MAEGQHHRDNPDRQRQPRQALQGVADGGPGVAGFEVGGSLVGRQLVGQFLVGLCLFGAVAADVDLNVLRVEWRREQAGQHQPHRDRKCPKESNECCHNPIHVFAQYDAMRGGFGFN
jgi:hypothetical protein